MTTTLVQMRSALDSFHYPLYLEDRVRYWDTNTHTYHHCTIKDFILSAKTGEVYFAIVETDAGTGIQVEPRKLIKNFDRKE